MLQTPSGWQAWLRHRHIVQPPWKAPCFVTSFRVAGFITFPLLLPVVFIDDFPCFATTYAVPMFHNFSSVGFTRRFAASLHLGLSSCAAIAAFPLHIPAIMEYRAQNKKHWKTELAIVRALCICEERKNPSDQCNDASVIAQTSTQYQKNKRKNNKNGKGDS